MRKSRLSAALWVASILAVAGCQGGSPSDMGASTETSADSSSEATSQEGNGSLFSFELGEGLGIEGVSPELVAHPDGGYLLLVTGLGQDRAYRSNDGVSFTPDPGMKIPMGSDYSLLQKPDGTWLLYYVTFDMPTMEPGQPGQPGEPSEPGQPVQPAQPMDPKTMKKKVMVSESSNLSSFPEGVPTGIQQDEPGMAWGVPDTWVDPDGSYRMMWVDMPEGERWEVLRTATSQDGITFTPDEGYAITDGYVDPFMLRAEEGDWVLLLSTTPATERLPQRIYVATSTNGMDWSIEDEPILYDEDRNYLDPAAVEVSPDEWVVVISTVEKANALSGPYEYVGARLTR
jgi:hypothetical protein